jgi:hypothetical protein
VRPAAFGGLSVVLMPRSAGALAAGVLLGLGLAPAGGADPERIRAAWKSRCA